MDTTQLLKGVLDLAVLAVVSDEDGYGYDVVRRLRAAGIEEVGDASVYGTLRRLYSSGALTSYVVPSDEGPHRKYYGINAQGRAMLEAAAQGLAGVRRHHGPPAQDGGRAMSVLDSTDVLDVAGYAAAVRRGLVDLGPELVEDLTDDLEADLAEALADERHVAHGRGLLEQFGPPEDYAAELRAAAGLAPAVAQAARVRLLSDPVEDTRRFGRWLLRPPARAPRGGHRSSRSSSRCGRPGG